jgi:hypothetical protein
MMDAGSIHDTEVNESLNAVAACEAWPIVRIVVGYELARCASISTTTRATLMLPASHSSTEQWATPSSSFLFMKPPRHGPARSSCSGCHRGLARAY